MNWNKVTITKDKRKDRAGYLVRWYGEYNPQKESHSRYCRSFKTRKEAELFASTKQTEINEGEPKDPARITLKQLCEQVIRIKKTECRASTMDGYEIVKQQLCAYFGPNTKITAINKQKAMEFLSTRKITCSTHLKAGKTELSPWGAKLFLKNGSVFFNMAVEWEYIKKNPFSKIKLSTPISHDWHFITHQEFQALLKQTTDFRLQCLYAIMYGTGLRLGEALNLLWNGKDIDFENNRINLRNRPASITLPPFYIKDHQNRSIPMPQWLTAMLVKLQNEAAPHNPFVFIPNSRWALIQKKWAQYQKDKKVDKWQNCLLTNNLLRNFKAHCRKAGIITEDKLTIHCMRKSYAQNLANNNIPIATLKNLMGHSSIRCTEDYYLKISTPNELAAVKVLDTLFTVPKTAQDGPE